MVQVYTRTAVEWMGGGTDGEREYPSFLLDVDQLQFAFDRIQSLAWCSLCHDDQDNGRRIFKGQEVELDVLALTPEDEPPGMKIGTLPPHS